MSQRRYNSRPRIGLTKTIKLTLPLEVWHELDDRLDAGEAKSYSEMIRKIIMNGGGECGATEGIRG